jgi:protein-S-isoprenylcysteine O-methyltransferase Ste14
MESLRPAVAIAFALARTVVWGSLFVALLLVFLPARLLARTGVTAPVVEGPFQIVGVAMAVVGAAIALVCILTFVFVGRGTPAPFDPPRSLVVRGPYRVVRNPMYFSATILLLGAALYYQSLALGLYAIAFLAACHAFVRYWEEPTLLRMFGARYEAYQRDVGRWFPRGSRDTTSGD